MNERHPLGLPAAEIPFHLRGYGGKIAVYYGANDDPVLAGFDAIGGLNFPPGLCRGYPAILARVEGYGGTGYRTICGWIQIVTRQDWASHDPGSAHAALSASVDMAPAFQPFGLPFACYGNLPQFFDAPCKNLNESARLVWQADTFLVTTPLRSLSEPVEWLAGFRWGYVETDLPDSLPEVLPLEVTGKQAWNEHLAFLSQEYGGFTFQTA